MSSRAAHRSLDSRRAHLGAPRVGSIFELVGASVGTSVRAFVDTKERAS